MRTRQKRRKQVPVDMSPAAIDRRLRDLSQVRRLGLSILTARKLGKAREVLHRDT